MGAEFLGNRAFTPADLNIAAGTAVTWVNSDATSHTSTSNAAGWDSGIVAPGGGVADGVGDGDGEVEEVE